MIVRKFVPCSYPC